MNEVTDFSGKAKCAFLQQQEDPIISRLQKHRKPNEA